MERAAPPATTHRPTSTTRPPEPARRRPATEMSFARTLAKLGLASAAHGEGKVQLAPASPGAALAGAPAAQPELAHPGAIQRKEPREPSDERDQEPEPEAVEGEPCDPAWAHRAALMAPPPGDVQGEARAHVEQVGRHASIEQLAPTLLRKMAWSGDGRRGAARLELGAGSLSGAVVTLEAEHGVVALSVEGLDPREESSLRRRLAEGLAARGFRLAP